VTLRPLPLMLFNNFPGQHARVCSFGLAAVELHIGLGYSLSMRYPTPHSFAKGCLHHSIVDFIFPTTSPSKHERVARVIFLVSISYWHVLVKTCCIHCQFFG
jgi:hypothetical protein